MIACRFREDIQHHLRGRDEEPLIIRRSIAELPLAEVAVRPNSGNQTIQRIELELGPHVAHNHQPQGPSIKVRGEVVQQPGLDRLALEVAEVPACERRVDGVRAAPNAIDL